MRNLFLFVFIILCNSCKEELNPFEFDNNNSVTDNIAIPQIDHRHNQD